MYQFSDEISFMTFAWFKARQFYSQFILVFIAIFAYSSRLLRSHVKYKSLFNVIFFMLGGVELTRVKKKTRVLDYVHVGTY